VEVTVTSTSLQTWLGARAKKLDEIEAAHSAVGGTAQGRRWATEQVNHAYAMLLNAQFQGFCRDLHSECAGHLVRSVTPSAVQAVVHADLLRDRRLDRGNPTPASLGADFNRLGLDFWLQVKVLHARNAQRLQRLAELSEWRNAIAHQDFDPGSLVPKRLHLGTIRSWRGICGALASSFDRVMRSYLSTATGSSPW